MKKILIADDDPISLRALEEYLKTNHFSYLVATNGTQAWELLQQNTDIGIVIADRIMPGLHAIQLLEKMKEHPLLNKTPVVILTGEAEKTDMVAAIRAGAFDFLYKPIEKELLQAIIQRALK
jgi:DNA-binding NtrC family response regulator